MTRYKSLLSATADRCVSNLESLGDRRVGPTAAAVRGLSAFDRPLQQESIDPAAVIEMLDTVGSPPGQPVVFTSRTSSSGIADPG